jgi:SAM-dependent methyltransferase
MTRFQILAIAFMLFILISYLKRFRRPALDKLFIGLLLATGIFFLLYPEVTNQLAHFLGIGRGADLIFYLAILGFGYMVMLLYSNLSLERIVPDQLNIADDFDNETLQLHIDRYSFAIRNGKPGDLLDIACGTGYGTYQIAQTKDYAKSRIVGVDIAQQAIDYAIKRYSDPAIRFICFDAMSYTDQNGYDTIISLETIEHLHDPGLFVKKLRSLLKKEGVLIISAPVTPSTDGNPHHFSNFSDSRFKKLFISSGFTIQSEFIQVQPFTLKNILGSDNQRLSKTRQHLGKFYLRHPGVFFARIRSLVKDGFNNRYMTLALRKYE